MSVRKLKFNLIKHGDGAKYADAINLLIIANSAVIFNQHRSIEYYFSIFHIFLIFVNIEVQEFT